MDRRRAPRPEEMFYPRWIVGYEHLTPWADWLARRFPRVEKVNDGLRGSWRVFGLQPFCRFCLVDVSWEKRGTVRAWIGFVRERTEWRIGLWGGRWTWFRTVFEERSPDFPRTGAPKLLCELAEWKRGTGRFPRQTLTMGRM